MEKQVIFCGKVGVTSWLTGKGTRKQSGKELKRKV